MQISLRQYGHLLGHYLRPQTGRVIWLSITLLGSIGLQILNPQILRYFIDTAMAGDPQQRLLVVALLFMSVAFIKQGLAIAATYFGENVAWAATNGLRIDLAEHCLNLDLAFHKAHTPGELIERIDGDVNALSRFFSQFIIQVIGNVILLLGILVVLFFEDWRAGLGLTLFTMTSLTVLTGLRSIAIRPWSIYRQISADFFGFIGERLAGLEDIRANGGVSYVMQRFYELLQYWLPAYHKARFTSTVLWGSTVGLFTVGNAIALAIGAYLWSRDAITIGTVYLIFYYANLLNDPIEQIREQFEDLQQAEASIYRISDLFNIQPRLSRGGETPLPTGALTISFEQVWFQYSDRETSDSEPLRSKPLRSEALRTDWTLKDISFHLPAGQVLGLLGRTGSGKTTIARLLLRLYDPQQGCIRLGNVPIEQTPLKDLPQHVGLVTQDVQLFQTTVRHNLTFFNSQIQDIQILETLDMLGLLPWLDTLPQGLDTELGSDSGGLSAGQAQLLAFARVFLKNPGLVILDEASSRLDPLTEQLIEKAVDRLLKGRTGIIIAHRLKTVERADQILVLDQGKVLEYGDRVSLACNQKSHFAQLLQLGSAELLA